MTVYALIYTGTVIANRFPDVPADGVLSLTPEEMQEYIDGIVEKITVDKVVDTAIALLHETPLLDGGKDCAMFMIVVAKFTADLKEFAKKHIQEDILPTIALHKATTPAHRHQKDRNIQVALERARHQHTMQWEQDARDNNNQSCAFRVR